MKLIGKLTTSVYEELLQLIARPGIKAPDQLKRFREIKNKYAEILNRIQVGKGRSADINPSYGWTEWARNIGNEFSSGVPLGFLGVKQISDTMVYCRNRGIAVSHSRIRRVVEVFGLETAGKILREDIIGLPKITDLRFRTSANRAHHASHLAIYTCLTGDRVWDADTIVEWGGGYGDMARIMRKVRADLTYIIIDLPELLPLQYIYLYSVEGPGSVRIVGEDGKIEKGMVNLLNSESAFLGDPKIHCDAFLSTWALTESPLLVQTAVVGEKFFGAEKILIAYNRNDGNIMPEVLSEFGLSEHEDDLLGVDHQYACR